MQNRITFSNVIGMLLKNKKKTYAQYQMIEDIFYDCLCHMDIFEKEDFEKILPTADGVPENVRYQRKYCPFMTIPDLMAFRTTFRMMSYLTLLM